MKEYLFHVTKTGSPGLDGKYRVIFSTDTTSKGQIITFCAVRKSPSNPIYSGTSVKHPKDAPDEYRGMHDAFKRAVQALINDFDDYTMEEVGNVIEWGYGVLDEKKAKSRFMGALWIAMGRPRKGELTSCYSQYTEMEEHV